MRMSPFIITSQLDKVFSNGIQAKNILTTVSCCFNLFIMYKDNKYLWLVMHDVMAGQQPSCLYNTKHLKYQLINSFGHGLSKQQPNP